MHSKHLPYLTYTFLVLAAIGGFIAINAFTQLLNAYHEAQTAYSQAGEAQLQENIHRLRAGVHESAVMEEAIRDAPGKDITVKRLALSIALSKPGTGFEDRILGLARNNASQEEIEQFKNSFLTSLFENFPPSRNRQEAILMQMDVVLIQLQQAAMYARVAEQHRNAGNLALEKAKAAGQALRWSLMQAVILVLAALFSLQAHSHTRLKRND